MQIIRLWVLGAEFISRKEIIMKLQNIFMALGVAGLLCIASLSTAWPVTTEKFVKEASIGNEFEVETSKLALEKSQNKDIRTFAQAMIDDHTKTEAELRELLQTSATGLKVEENLDGKHQDMMNKLQSLSTDNFNHEYVSMQTKAHKEAMDLFRSYSKNGDDPALKKFAADTLPTLEEHLKLVKKLKQE